MNESFVIILPLPSKILHPNSTIATIGGRFAKASAIKKFKRLTQEAIESEQIDNIPWNYVSVFIRFFFRINRRRDTDNAIGSCKSIYDGIVLSGLVIDDTPKYMKRNEPEFLIDEKNPRLEITLERIK